MNSKLNIISLAALILIEILFCSCNQKHKSTEKEIEFALLVEKKIKLEESTKPIGYIGGALVTKDSLLYILDYSASDIKIYNLNGGLVNSMFSKGNGPLNLRTPRSFALFNDKVIVGDVGFYSFKLFNNNGKELKTSIFINGIRPIGGDTKFIDVNSILSTGFWDYEFNGESKSASNSCIIFDTSGNIKKRFGKYPLQYEKFKYLDGSSFLDINNFGDFVIVYSQSPDISIGNIYRDNIFEYKYPEIEGKYIISDLENAKPTEEFWNQVNTKIFYNTGVHFLTDSLIVRSLSRHNIESVKSGSFVSAENYIELFTIDGKKIKEFKTDGTLIAVQKKTNLLFFESSDLPDNRIITICKIKIH
ncbi:MAG: hypothetical protein SFU91_03530 [Chloroherpetonaceae bacterium]|nr:hypothetical protein [Chloroherpetonaceae bacterium]